MSDYCCMLTVSQSIFQFFALSFRIILALRICSEVKDNPPVDIHQRRDWKYMDIENRSSFLVSGKSERVDSTLNGASKLGRVHQVEANANFFFPRCTLWLGEKTINIDNKNASKQ